VLQASAGLSERLDGRYSRIPLGRGAVGCVARDRQPLLLQPAVNHPLIQDQACVRHDAIESFAAYPLVAEGQLMGVAAVFSRREIAASLMRGVAPVADSIAVAIRRWQSQTALVRSERRFRSLLEHSTDAIALFDREGVIRYVGPSTTRVMGYTPDQLPGRPAADLVHPDDLGWCQELSGKVMAHPGIPVPCRFRRRADGSFILAGGTLTHLLDDPGVGMIVDNYRDVT
jgi:PAS domain S-box-containing protein